MGNGDDEFTSLLVGSVLDGIKVDGMSIVFKDESLEVELSSMTSKVVQDGNDDGDGQKEVIKQNIKTPYLYINFCFLCIEIE